MLAITYTGARQVTRTPRVAGAGGLEDDAVTTKTSDRQGKPSRRDTSVGGGGHFTQSFT